MWDPVPWFVGGGAEHSPEVARMMLFAATGGAEGVVLPEDLRVTALDVPGGAVKVLPGGALVRNRATGGDSQTYGGRLPTQDVVEVAATGSAGGRSSMVIARVEDPNMAGETWDDADDPTIGPYIFTRIIPNVPPAAKRLQDVPGYSGQSGIAVARIDQPASTGTITNAMIVDLRTVAIPRSTRSLDLQVGTAAQLNSATAEVSFPQNTLPVSIPEWATRLTGYMTANGVIQKGSDEAMSTRIRLGANLYSRATVTDLDAETGDGQRRTMLFAIDMQIPAEMRGTVQTLSAWSTRLYSTATGRFVTDKTTQVMFDLFFEEART